MDLHYRQEVTVGVLVLAGIGLFLGGTMWLRGKSFSRAPQVEIVFPDVGTLKRGSPVRVSGVELGSVERIEFEGVGQVLVAVTLDPKVTPRIDATARLASVGLVGDAVVVLHPGTAAEPLPPGRRIQGAVDQGLTDLGSDLGSRAKDLMAGVQEFTNAEMAGELRATLQALQRTLDVYANTARGPAAEMTRTMASLQQLTRRLDSTLAAADLPATLRRGDTLMRTLSTTGTEFAATAARLDTLLQRVNRGDGTLGRLMTDSLLYGDVRRLTQAAQEFLDELRKHPGKITIQVKVF
jgi:phospholipid/cholesterol/gamma-HCH transport system substrate-binding protein